AFSIAATGSVTSISSKLFAMTTATRFLLMRFLLSGAVSNSDLGSGSELERTALVELLDYADGLRHRHSAEILSRAQAYRDRSRLRFTLADNKHERNLLELRVSDLRLHAVAPF